MDIWRKRESGRVEIPLEIFEGKNKIWHMFFLKIPLDIILRVAFILSSETRRSIAKLIQEKGDSVIPIVLGKVLPCTQPECIF